MKHVFVTDTARKGLAVLLWWDFQYIPIYRLLSKRWFSKNVRIKTRLPVTTQLAS